MKAVLSVAVCGLLLSVAEAAKLATFDGITFSDTGKRLYLPIREASKALDWPLRTSSNGWIFHGKGVPSSVSRSLIDGTKLVDVAWLKQVGAIVHESHGMTVVKDARRPGKAFYVRKGMKRVFVNKKTQMLVAYQGQRTVFRSKVSTGREGKETPTGIFKAQGYKSKLHRSRLYNNTPLPWSVQIVGNIFVHGYRSVGSHSSHGCVRLPVEGANPARWFYYWIDKGTPVTILGKWPKNAA